MEILFLFIVMIIIVVVIGKKRGKSPLEKERVEGPRNQQYEKTKLEEIINEKAVDKDSILLDAQEALKQEMNEDRRNFIQHIINTADLRQERLKICDYLHNDNNKERHPDEYEEKLRLLDQNFKALKDINIKFSANYPKDVMKAYKRFSAAFNINLREIWVLGEEHKDSSTHEIKLEDIFLSSGGIGQSFLGYNNPNFNIGDDTYYFFPMYVAICKKDTSKFELVGIEGVSVTYENQEYKEKRHLISGSEVERCVFFGEYKNQASIYSKDIIGTRLYGKLTIHPFDVTLYASNLQKGVRLFKAINEYVDFIKSKKGLTSGKTTEDVPKQERSEIANQIDINNNPDCYYHFDETIEVFYTVFGYDRLGETTFDMEVKDKEYEWLQNAEGEEGELTSGYISENRPSLHKRIIKAIRKNMKDEACDPDDGLVETYVSGVHRKDFYEDASYDYASDFAEDDDIEYTVTL